MSYLPAAVVVVALACAACGGGGNQSTGSGTTTTAGGATSSSRPTPATTPPSTTTTAPVTTTSPKGGPVPAGFDPVSFTAVTAAEFWLLGEAPCANPVCTSIVRSDDGGSSFAGIPAPPAPLTTGQGAGVDTLRFADASDGYAFALGNQGSNFWSTHDGGAHWSAPRNFSGKTLLAFGTGAGYAFALVATCQSGSCSAVTLERSRVRDDSWAALPVTLPASSGPLASMTVHGANIWLSIGATTSQANQVLLAGTRSGGSFSTYQSPCSPGLGGTIQAASDNVLWAVCPTGMMSEAFRSADGGAHWSSLKTGQLVNSTQLAPVSDTIAYLVPSAQGPFLGTTDAGLSWRNVSGTTTTGTWSWAWVGFTDSRTGSALQEQGTAPAGWPWPKGPLPYQLWRTTDGGASWSGPVKIS